MLQSNIVKIIVADSHKLVREGIISLLNTFPNFLVVDEAENGLELINKFKKTCVDIILIDTAMSPISGLEAFIELKKYSNNFKALFLSITESSDHQVRVTHIGGHGLVSKYIGANELAYAINLIMSGECYFSKINLNGNSARKNESITKKRNGSNGKSIEKLSKKEEELMNLLTEGLTSSEIATRLFISKRTVDTHRKHILEKFNLKSSAELMKFAFERTNTNHEDI